MPNRKQLVSLSLFAIIALLIATTVSIFKERCSIYRYDVTKNYEYDFSTSGASIIKLKINNERITLPLLDNIGRSSFLKISVNTTLLGRYLQPSITFTSKNESFTQYFERGAKGIRYINISSLSSKKGAEIVFKGRYISINDKTAELISFKNKNVEKAKILFLSPHPDDAEIAAYGLYSSNKDSYIVTVTAGDEGKFKYDEIYQDTIKHYLKKGELRTWNSITVPLLGGIPPEQTINLGFFNGTLKAMYMDKSSVVSGIFTQTSDITTYRKQNVSSMSIGLDGKSDWNSLVGNLEYLLKEIKPDIVVAPYPLLDNHPDHKFSSIALFEAIKKSGIKTGDLYLWTDHLAFNEYYPYGEMGGVVSIPPNFRKAIYFHSIYSHPLSIDKQKDKIFAFEAMNDLRLDTEWRFSKGVAKIAIGTIERNIRDRNYSYYRRAIRSNELFFVIEIGDIYNEDKLNRIIGEF